MDEQQRQQQIQLPTGLFYLSSSPVGARSDSPPSSDQAHAHERSIHEDSENPQKSSTLGPSDGAHTMLSLDACSRELRWRVQRRQELRGRKFLRSTCTYMAATHCAANMHILLISDPQHMTLFRRAHSLSLSFCRHVV